MSRANDRETLSAMLDNEAGDLELRRLLRDLDEDGLGRWGRWQAARDLMHGHEIAPVPEGFGSRLRQALQEEEQSTRAGQGIVSHLTRAGVAASVALAIVFGWQFMADETTEPGTTEQVVQVDLGEIYDSGAAREGAPVMGEAATVSGGPGSAGDTGASGQASERINQMMLRHSESAARHGGQGMVPYVRLISLDALQEDR